jgi:hypothetical protein
VFFCPEKPGGTGAVRRTSPENGCPAFMILKNPSKNDKELNLIN